MPIHVFICKSSDNQNHLHVHTNQGDMLSLAVMHDSVLWLTHLSSSAGVGMAAAGGCMPGIANPAGAGYW